MTSTSFKMLGSPHWLKAACCFIFSYFHSPDLVAGRLPTCWLPTPPLASPSAPLTHRASKAFLHHGCHKVASTSLETQQLSRVPGCARLQETDLTSINAPSRAFGHSGILQLFRPTARVKQQAQSRCGVARIRRLPSLQSGHRHRSTLAETQHTCRAA